MINNNEQERTLRRNGIVKFILKVDLMPDSKIDFVKIINEVSPNYDRTEKKIQPHIHINFLPSGQSEVNKTDATDYVLIKEDYRYSTIFSPLNNAFWFETSQYIDNSTYKAPMSKIIQSFKTHYPDISAKRIGMRFVNEFHLPALRHISKVFNKEVARTLTSMATREFVSRVIAQEEYNFSSSKLRVQYSIPNKFYPAVLNNYDLQLDIDSFDDTQQIIDNWESSLVDLNHKAYRIFFETVNPKYIEELK